MAVQLNVGPAPKKSKASKSGLAIFITVIAFGIAALVFFIIGFVDYMKMKDMQLTWKEIQDVADGDDDTIDEYVDEKGNVLKVADNEDDPLFRSINLEALKAINSDVSGYIYIPNTNIDYPILKETTVNQYFYEKHDIYKNYTAYGSIFELCDEEKGGANAPITYMFGHHMGSGDMFSQLYSFEDEAFAKDASIYVYRGTERTEYKVMSVNIIDKRHRVYNFGTYDRGSAEYADLINELKTGSVVSTNYSITNNDDMLVLSTCKGRAGTSTRIIVVGVKYRTLKIAEDSELNKGGE